MMTHFRGSTVWWMTDWIVCSINFSSFRAGVIKTYAKVSDRMVSPELSMIARALLDWRAGIHTLIASEAYHCYSREVEGPTPYGADAPGQSTALGASGLCTRLRRSRRCANALNIVACPQWSIGVLLFMSGYSR